jgi:uncharacterized protein Yka (UPF0111/DUF47 family)
MRLPRAWFLPGDVDVLGQLRAQTATVHTAAELVSGWCRGAVPTGEAVERLRDLAVVETEQRKALNAGIRESFSTPLEAEDIYELAERLHELADGLYALVREADLSLTRPDAALVRIVDAVAAAVGALAGSMARLPRADAADLADQAVEHLAAAEHAYRSAIAELEHETDLRREVRRRELYRRAEHLTKQAARVAHRIWYAVYKRS